MNDYFSKWCCLIFFNPPPGSLQNLSFDSNINFTKHLYSHNEIKIDENNSIEGCKNFMIEGGDLGLQLQTAFENAFASGFRKVVLIKNDFTMVSFQQIVEAFGCLKIIEFCIGPKDNGDYYLLGMNYFETSLFKNKQWDAPTLTKDTIKDIGKLKLALYKLRTLKSEEYVTGVNT